MWDQPKGQKKQKPPIFLFCLLLNIWRPAKNEKFWFFFFHWIGSNMVTIEIFLISNDKVTIKQRGYEGFCKNPSFSSKMAANGSIFWTVWIQLPSLIIKTILPKKPDQIRPSSNYDSDCPHWWARAMQKVGVGKECGLLPGPPCSDCSKHWLVYQNLFEVRFF